MRFALICIAGILGMWPATAARHLSSQTFAVTEVEGSVVTLILAGIGVGFTVLAGVVKLLWGKVSKCHEQHADCRVTVATLEERVVRQSEEIGTLRRQNEGQEKRLRSLESRSSAPDPFRREP